MSIVFVDFFQRKGFGMTIYEKVTTIREKMGISQSELERKANLSKGTITNWKNRNPNMSSIEKVANALGYDVAYFISDDEKQEYYLNDDAREIAQFMYDNPEYKVLFDASRKVKKEDIEFVKQMLDRFRTEE